MNYKWGVIYEKGLFVYNDNKKDNIINVRVVGILVDVSTILDNSINTKSIVNNTNFQATNSH